MDAFKAGVLSNMVKKAQNEQSPDKTEFQANPGDSSDPDDPKNKPNYSKDVYPRDQRIDHALDAIDSVFYNRRKGARR